MILVVLGAVGSIGGAALLVGAFRRGQAGDREGERRMFAGAVAGLGTGMVLFAIALLTAPH